MSRGCTTCLARLKQAARLLANTSLPAYGVTASPTRTTNRTPDQYDDRPLAEGPSSFAEHPSVNERLSAWQAEALSALHAFERETLGQLRALGLPIGERDDGQGRIDDAVDAEFQRLIADHDGTVSTLAADPSTLPVRATTGTQPVVTPDIQVILEEAAREATELDNAVRRLYGDAAIDHMYDVLARRLSQRPESLTRRTPRNPGTRSFTMTKEELAQLDREIADLKARRDERRRRS